MKEINKHIADLLIRLNSIHSLECGAEAFLDKPADVSEFTAQIRAMVKIKRANSEKSGEKSRLTTLVEEQTRELNKTHLDTLTLLAELKIENEARKIIEAALRRSEEQHRVIIQTAMDGFLMSDSRGHILGVNETFCRISGYSVQELMIMRVSDLDASETIYDAVDHFYKLKAQGENRFESRYRRKDGSIYDVEISAQYRPFDGGQVVAFIRDITKRKQNEMYGELGREILHILNKPGTLQDSVRRVISALKDRTGFDAVGIRLQNGDDFPYYAQEGFAKDFVQSENKLSESCAEKGVYRKTDGSYSLACTCGLVISGRTDPTNSLFTKGGSFWCNNLFPLLEIPPDEDPRFHPRNECMHEGYSSMALIPIRDLTSIVGLIQFNDQRKGCFSLQTIELLEGIASHIGEAVMRKRAEEELQKKDSEIEQFMYTVSHDLRSPLVTVKTFMGYLEKDIAEGNREQLTEDIQFIHNAADKMKLLLDELLELSRIGRIGTPPVRVPFKRVVTDVLDSLAGVISLKNAAIQLPETDLMLFGDYSRFCQTWQNLIENAIKYSRDGCIPSIELGVQRINGDAVFFVKDNGIGIESQYHSKIFGIFEKLDSKSPGAGLGLSMIQRIVEKFGGRVWVESEGLGRGACFYFTLPHALVHNETAMIKVEKETDNRHDQNTGIDLIDTICIGVGRFKTGNANLESVIFDKPSQ